MDFKNILLKELSLKSIENYSYDLTWLFYRKCVLRVLPLVGYSGNFDFWKKEDAPKYLYYIFNHIDGLFGYDNDEQLNWNDNYSVCNYPNSDTIIDVIDIIYETPEEEDFFDEEIAELGYELADNFAKKIFVDFYDKLYKEIYKIAYDAVHKGLEYIILNYALEIEGNNKIYNILNVQRSIDNGFLRNVKNQISFNHRYIFNSELVTHFFTESIIKYHLELGLFAGFLEDYSQSKRDNQVFNSFFINFSKKNRKGICEWVSDDIYSLWKSVCLNNTMLPEPFFSKSLETFLISSYEQAIYLYDEIYIYNTTEYYDDFVRELRAERSIQDTSIFHIAYSTYLVGKKLGVDFSSVIINDLRGLETNSENQLSTKVYGKIWDNFQSALRSIDCRYWADWYSKLFENNTTFDSEEVEIRVILPKEIINQGAAIIGEYMQNLEKTGKKRYNEARIIILGDKGAGKTCVARKLINPDALMTTPEESTPGVDTSLWELEEHDLNIRIWDFAGHTVTHAVHQFFLSERCLYIMVYNGRTENNERLKYWLDHMSSYGGDSKAIILVNEQDKHRPDIPINALKEQYAIAGFDSFDIGTDRDSLIAFRNKVADYIIHNPSWKNQEIPANYYQVKEDLEQLFEAEDKEHISKETFIQIAEKHEIEKPEILLKSLHALGVSLWYKDMGDYDTLVLNPEWISQGVYTIINWVNNQEAHSLSLDCFSKVFEDDLKRYPVDKHEFLFNLMKHYELAFEVKGQRRLLIPHLFKEDQPVRLPEFPVGESLMLKYEANKELLPHTISRFIVRHNEQIKKEGAEAQVWRYGVILEDGKGSEAMVREKDRSISVSVKGRKKTAFMDELRATLKDIFESYVNEKPELSYRIDQFGKVPTKPIWLSNENMEGYIQDNRPYYDGISRQDIPLQKAIEIFALKMVDNLGNAGRFRQLERHITEEHDKTREILKEIPDIFRNDLEASQEQILADVFQKINEVDINVEEAKKLTEMVGKGVDEAFRKQPTQEELVAAFQQVLIKDKEPDGNYKGKLKANLWLIPLVLKYEAELSMDNGITAYFKSRWKKDGFKGLFLE